jgi:serine/threonine protein kinase
LVQAVDQVHRRGVAHRDLTPQNILVTPDGADRDAVLAVAQALARERFRVAHATIQIEGVAAGAACPQRPTDAL